MSFGRLSVTARRRLGMIAGPIIIAGLLAVALYQGWFSGSTIHQSPDELSKIQPLLGRTTVRYTFICPTDFLTRLQVKLVTYNRRNTVAVRLALRRPGDDQPLRQGTVPGEPVRDWAFTGWSFSPVIGQKGRPLELVVSSPGAGPRNCLGLLLLDPQRKPANWSLSVDGRLSPNGVMIRLRSAFDWRLGALFLGLSLALIAVRLRPEPRVGHIALFGAYLLIRWLIYSTGWPTHLGVDSDTLIQPSLAAWSSWDLWAGAAPPGGPVFHKLLGGSWALICHFQFILSLAAWSALALTAGRVIAGWVAWPTMAVVLAFSCGLDVTVWDGLLRSESLTLSWLALTLAAWLAFIRRPGWSAGGAVLIFSLLTALTRDVNAYLILGSAVCLVGVALVRRLGPAAWLVVVGLIGVFLMSNYSADRGQRWVNPFLDVVGKRILTDPDRLADMTRLGMPVSDRLRAAAGHWAKRIRMSRDYVFLEWVPEKGKSTYIKYLLTHPVYLASAPLTWPEDRTALFAAPLPWDDRAKGFRHLFVDSAANWLYPKSRAGLIGLALAAAGVLVAGLTIRRRLTGPQAFGLVVTGAAYPLALVVWHGDAMDIARHALLVGLCLRLGLWLTICFSLGAIFRAWPTKSKSTLPKQVKARSTESGNKNPA